MKDEEWVTGEVKLRINGQPVEMQLTVPAFPVKAQRMLPIFQKMSSAVVDVSANFAVESGKTISCKAGCGACCRQAVPISEVEAYHVADLVEAMSEPRRTEVRQRFADALAHFREVKWFDQYEELKRTASISEPDLSAKEFERVVLDYFRDGIACPFLENESCSIHIDRPLVCREYLVTSPAENCRDPKPTNIDRVPIFLQPSKAMPHVGRTANMGNCVTMMLIEALEFVEKHPVSAPERTGREWASDFMNRLTDSAQKPANTQPKRTLRRKKRHK